MITPHRPSRRALALLSLAFAAALWSPPNASAHNVSSATQHSLAYDSSRFSGRLTSLLTVCTSSRPVTLYRTGPAGDSAVATTQTDASGVWTTSTAGFAAGSFYAIAHRLVLKESGHRHTCEAARSNSVTFSPDADGDGFTAYGGDCADNDAARHPGAPDNTLDGVDNDCDGSVDEGYNSNPIVCDAMSYFAFDPVTGTWSCAPLSTYSCNLDDNALEEWNAYLAADPTLSDPELQAGLTYPLNAYINCFGF